MITNIQVSIYKSLRSLLPQTVDAYCSHVILTEEKLEANRNKIQ